MTKSKSIITVCAALILSSGMLVAPASAMTSMQMHKHQKTMMMHKGKMMHHKRMMMRHKTMMNGNT